MLNADDCSIFLKKKKTRYLRPEVEREGPMEGPDLGKPMEMEWFE